MSIGRWAAIALLCVLLQPRALSTQQPPSSESSGAVVLPACAACMHHLPEDCDFMARAPLVARVAGTRIVASQAECEEMKHPNDAARCFESAAYQFDSVRFLRNDVQADARDRFASRFNYERFGSPSKAGVFLEAGASYTIFAARAVADFEPPARWFITSACKLTTDHVDQAN
jgi:hypothetical protein